MNFAVSRFSTPPKPVRALDVPRDEKAVVRRGGPFRTWKTPAYPDPGFALEVDMNPAAVRVVPKMIPPLADGEYLVYGGALIQRNEDGPRKRIAGIGIVTNRRIHHYSSTIQSSAFYSEITQFTYETRLRYAYLHLAVDLMHPYIDRRIQTTRTYYDTKGSIRRFLDALEQFRVKPDLPNPHRSS